MLRKTFKIILAVLVLITAFSNVAMAQMRNESHNLSLYAIGGYSNFLHSTPETTTLGLMSAGIGFGYEYRINKFYIHMGIEGMSLNSTTNLNKFKHTETVKDTEGEEVHYSYKFNNIVDYHYSVYVGVPIILGYNDPKGMYFGVGVKFGMPIMGGSNVIAKYTTAGVYDKYIGEFVDMPNHFYTDYSEATRTPVIFQPNLSAIFEIGANVWKSKPKKKDKGPMVLKVGAYAEYGLLNIISNNNLSPIVRFSEPGEDASKVKMNPIFNSVTNDSFKSVNPFVLGVKATLLFEMIVPKRCACLQTKKGLNMRRNKITF